jgi:hypothetical protein
VPSVIGTWHRPFYHAFNVPHMLAVLSLTGNLLWLGLDSQEQWASVLRLALVCLVLIHSSLYVLMWNPAETRRLWFGELPRLARSTFIGLSANIMEEGSKQAGPAPTPTFSRLELVVRRAHVGWLAFGCAVLFALGNVGYQFHPTFDEPRLDGPLSALQATNGVLVFGYLYTIEVLLGADRPGMRTFAIGIVFGLFVVQWPAMHWFEDAPIPFAHALAEAFFFTMGMANAITAVLVQMRGGGGASSSC